MLKPDMRMIWANSGDVVTPPESKVDLGWILEKPPSQYFNWHLNRTDRMLSHINRRGIPSWSSDTEYHTNGIASYVVGGNGRVYVSVAPSGNNTSPAKNPTTDTTREFWKPAFVGWDEAIPESQITGLTTKLNSKVDKTQRVNTSNGLSGGGALSGDLTIRPTYGTTANTVTQGNDPRLSNSREWSASTVGEAEAKAGTATTRRAWTSQRVHQAADGWYDKKFSTIVKNILSRSNAQQIRNDLQLGTAATRDVVSNRVDVSGGNKVVTQGWMGLGAKIGYSISRRVTPEQEITTGFWATGDSSNLHLGMQSSFCNVLAMDYRTQGDYTSIQQSIIDGSLTLSGVRNGEQIPPRVVLDTGNILSSTGTSSLYPMTQAAVTSALNTKADTSYVDTELDKKATVGTGATQVRTNSQLDSRYVQGQAGTSGTQFRNNSQNDSRYIQGGSVVQTTGTSTTNVMSQKAVTDSLAEKVDSSSVSVALAPNTIPQRDANGRVEVAPPAADGHATNRAYVAAQIGNIESSVTDKMLGVGQSWLSLNPIRDVGTIYTNTTGKPIQVSVTTRQASGNNSAEVSLTVDGVLVARSGSRFSSNEKAAFVTAIIPSGSTYRAHNIADSYLYIWAELR